MHDSENNIVTCDGNKVFDKFSPVIVTEPLAELGTYFCGRLRSRWHLSLLFPTIQRKQIDVITGMNNTCMGKVHLLNTHIVKKWLVSPDISVGSTFLKCKHLLEWISNSMGVFTIYCEVPPWRTSKFSLLKQRNTR